MAVWTKGKWRTIVSVFSVAAMLVSLLVPYAPNASAAPSNSGTAAGQWLSWRNDTGNSGMQPDAGDLSEAAAIEQLFIKGAVDRSPVFADVNGDGQAEMLTVDAGRVAAVDLAGNDVWMSEVVLAQQVYAVDDLNGDGTDEVIVFADKKLVILDAADGTVLFSQELDEQLSAPRFALADFDRDGLKEAAYYLYKRPFINIMKFSTASDGSFVGEVINRIIDTSTENAGNIAAFSPGLAVANMDEDAYDELAVIRHGGVDLYDGLEIGTKLEAPSLLYEPLTFVAVQAESEYPGGGYPATNLIDGNLTSYYISEPRSGPGVTTGSGWVDLDLGSPRLVSKLSVYYLHGCGFEVQTWDALQGWVTRATFASTDVHYSSDGEYRTDIDFGSYVSTDRVRIQVTASSYGDGNGAYQVQFTEVKAFGDATLPAIVPTQLASDDIRSITADSNYPGYSPALLINGNTSDYWISEQKTESAEGMKGEATIQVDLASKRTIAALRFHNLIVPYVEVAVWNINEERWDVQRTIDETAPVQAGLVSFTKPVETNKVRVKISRSTFGDGNGLYHVQFSELELFEVTHRIVVQSVQAEGEYPGGGYPVSNLIDGDTSSYFISNPKDEASGSTWVELELSEQTAIGSLVVHALNVPDVQVQVYDDDEGQWQTRASGDLLTTPSPATFDFSSQPLVTDRLRLAISGSNFGGTGAYHVQFTEIELFKPAGAADQGLAPQSSVNWIPTGASSGRNYGYFGLTDVTGSSDKEAVIVADGVSFHVGVAANDDGALSLLWDRYYGYAGQPSPSDHLQRTMKVVNDPIVDVNGDGRPEIVFGMFETVPGAAEGTWYIHALNASNPDHADSVTIPGYYLWGIEDVNGDGVYELLVTEETTETPAGTASIEVLAWNGEDAFEPIFEQAGGSFAMANRKVGMNISAASYSGLSRPLLFDANGDGQDDLMIRTANGYKAIGFSPSGHTEIASYPTQYGAPFAVTATSAGQPILFFDDGAGMMTALDHQGTQLWQRASGGPLKATPVVGDIDGDGVNEMVVCTGSGIAAYKLNRGGAAPMWTADGYCRHTHSLTDTTALADMDGNGQLDVITAGSSGGKPEIRVRNGDGSLQWSYVFEEDLNGQPLGFTAGSVLDYVVADITGDGVPDVYVALQNTYPTGRSAIIDGATRQLLYITEPTVEVTYANHPTSKPARAMLPMPGNAAAYDTDGDGAAEIYFVALETLVRLDYDQTLQTVKLDYHIPQVSAQDTVIYYNTPIIVDVDNDATHDGPEHIMAGGFNSFTVFSNELPVAGDPLAHPAKLWQVIMPVTEYNDDDTPKNYGDNDISRRIQGVGDTDGNGTKTIALQYTTDDDRGVDQFRGMLYAYDAVDGTVKWTYDMKPAFGGKGVTARDIIAVDIDGDGRDEFIVTTNTGWVIAFNGENDAALASNEASRVLWSVRLGISVGTPIAADADADGLSDVLVPADDGYIYVIGKPNADIYSSTYTIGAPISGQATISNVPYGTTKAQLLAALSKGQGLQTWDTDNIAETVSSGNSLTVTAPGGSSTVTYTVAVLPPPNNGGNGNQSGSGSSSAGATIVPTVTENATYIVATAALNAKAGANGAVAAIVDEKLLDAMTALVADAANTGKRSEVALVIEHPPGVSAVTVELHANAFKRMTEQTDATLRLKSGVTELAFSASALAAVAGQLGSDATFRIEMSVVEAAALSEGARHTVGDRPVLQFVIRSGDRVVSDFGGGSVIVQVPYTPEANERANAIFIYHVDEDGRTEPVQGQYDAALGAVMFAAKHFSKFVIGYRQVDFRDVIAGAWHYDAIDFLAARGTVQGTGDGRFAPGAAIRRADVLIMLMNAFGIAPDSADAANNFADSQGKYYSGYTAAAKRLDLVRGIDSMRFDPEAPLRRQDLFVMMYSMSKYVSEAADAAGTSGTEETLRSFKDAHDVSGYAANAVASLIGRGWVVGDGQRLHPLRETTRAEAAAVVYHALLLQRE